MARNDLKRDRAPALRPDERRNALLIYAGEGIWGVQGGLISGATVLAVLLQKLGAQPNHISLIGAIDGLCVLLPLLIGVYLFYHGRPVKMALLGWHLAITPVLVAMALVVANAPRFSPMALTVLLLAGYAASRAPLLLVTAAWSDWMARLFPERVRGSVMGLMMASGAAASVCGGLFASWLIGLDSSATGYWRLYGIAAVCVVLCMAVFYFVAEGAANAMAKPSLRRREVFSHFGDTIRDRNTRAFLVGQILAIFGFAVVPAMSVHYRSAAGGGVSEQFIVTCGALLSLGMTVAQVVLGRLGDKHGHRVGMLVAVCMQIATLAVLLLLSGSAGCAIAYGAAGLAAGCGMVAEFNLLIETCPHQSRLAHITASKMVQGVAMIIAPLLASELVKRFGTPTLFAVSGVFSLASLAWVTWRLQDPRRQTAAAEAS